MELEEIKTPCCNADWQRKGRADYRCKECGKGVTLELVLIYDALKKEEQQIG